MTGNGGQIGPFNLSTRKSANGVWTPNEIAARIEQDIWPTTPDPLFASVKLLMHATSVLGQGMPTDMSAAGATLGFSGAGGGVGFPVNYTTTSTPLFSPLCFYCGNTGTGGIKATFPTVTIGAQAFCIEMFWRIPTPTDTSVLFDFRRVGSPADVLPAVYITGNTIRYFTANADRITSSTAAIPVATWVHIALARSGTSTKLFVAGNQVGSTYSDSNSYVAMIYGMIGQYSVGNASGSPVDGKFDEIRMTIGNARYTSNFTPPTERFPDW